MIQPMSQIQGAQLSTAFRTSADDLAGDLRDACLPLLPSHQARLVRFDELHVSSGLETQSPLAAAVMALGPAVAAAGASVAGLGGMESQQAQRTVGVAQSVIDAGVDALDVLETPTGGDLTIDLAHRVAHATHLASTLAPDARLASRQVSAGHPPRPLVLWPRLLESLNHGISSHRGVPEGGCPTARQHRLHAAAACRDAAAASMRAHARLTTARPAWSSERLIRCLTFASLYCGFATLEAGRRLRA